MHQGEKQRQKEHEAGWGGKECEGVGPRSFYRCEMGEWAVWARSVTRAVIVDVADPVPSLDPLGCSVLEGECSLRL